MSCSDVCEIGTCANNENKCVKNEISDNCEICNNSVNCDKCINELFLNQELDCVESCDEGLFKNFKLILGYCENIELMKCLETNFS